MKKSLKSMLGPVPELSPFQRGVKDSEKGRPAPAFPTPDSDWEERLYNRGYLSVSKPAVRGPGQKCH